MRRGAGARAVAAALVTAGAALAGALVGCETVNLGAPPADINACRPGQNFFVAEIWPNVLAKDYGGKHCYDAACHDVSSGRPLTLTIPMNAGAVPLPADWAANYRSASEHMNCTNVKASELLALPSGLRTHGGGKLFEEDGPEATLIQMWVGQP